VKISSRWFILTIELQMFDNLAIASNAAISPWFFPTSKIRATVADTILLFV